jgi:hypothetical protein
VLEHRPVGDQTAVTAQRAVRYELSPGGQAFGELVTEGFEQAGSHCGHGRPS